MRAAIRHFPRHTIRFTDVHYSGFFVFLIRSFSYHKSV